MMNSYKCERLRETDAWLDKGLSDPGPYLSYYMMYGRGGSKTRFKRGTVVFRRQSLKSEDGPRAERIKTFIIAVDQ